MPAAGQSSNAAPPSGALISKLSRFVVGVRYDAIPPKALETAKIAIMDCLGVAVAGGTEESARIAGRLAREDGGKETATLYGQRFKLPAVQATLINGIAANAHDFDQSLPMTSEELLSKFRACTRLAISTAASERAVEQIRALETLASIRPLVAQLRGTQ